MRLSGGEAEALMSPQTVANIASRVNVVSLVTSLVRQTGLCKSSGSVDLANILAGLAYETTSRHVLSRGEVGSRLYALVFGWLLITKAVVQCFCLVIRRGHF